MRATGYWTLLAICLACGTGCRQGKKIEVNIAKEPKTFCNPINLSYRFMKIKEGAGIREAADPVVVSYGGEYWLFASKSSGYWHTTDFNTWKYVFIPDSVLPIEDYAPGIFVYNGYIYYTGSTRGEATLYRSNSPETGSWEPVGKISSNWDPAFFVEGDSLYLYYGSSPSDPIKGQCFDLKTLKAQGKAITCFNSHPETHGWERPGERNELARRPYLEGAWMTKHNKKYYLQYAVPGTEWKTYADGTYVSDRPLGPFEYLPCSPVSYKPTGFLGGAGHGCIFQAGEEYWKAATNAISVRHMFERRISFYPARFDSEGNLYTNTEWGDYPLYLPGKGKGKTHPGWMLLSEDKPVTASSSMKGHPASRLVDEDVRTAWTAQSNQTEWVVIDLEQEANIAAIQVNYDEQGATWKGRQPGLYQSYILYASHDGKTWYVIVDKSGKKTDTPHDYTEFKSAFKARYIKWENHTYTISNNVSLRELRIFGTGTGEKPTTPSALTVTPHPTDKCRATLQWEPTYGAKGYVIHAGIKPDKLYQTYQTADSTYLELTGLNADTEYYFSIDAYNENGVTKGKDIECLKRE